MWCKNDKSRKGQDQELHAFFRLEWKGLPEKGKAEKGIMMLILDNILLLKNTVGLFLKDYKKSLMLSKTVLYWLFMQSLNIKNEFLNLSYNIFFKFPKFFRRYYWFNLTDDVK